jgi:hypothetical protein
MKCAHCWRNVAKVCSNGQLRLSDQRICVGGDFSYELGTEHLNVLVAGNEVQAEFRVTNIYRREGALLANDPFEWRTIRKPLRSHLFALCHDCTEIGQLRTVLLLHPSCRLTAHCDRPLAIKWIILARPLPKSSAVLTLFFATRLQYQKSMLISA